MKRLDLETWFSIIGVAICLYAIWAPSDKGSDEDRYKATYSDGGVNQ